MSMQCLLDMVDTADVIHVQASWKSLSATEATLEALFRVHKDRLAIVKTFIAQKRIYPV